MFLSIQDAYAVCLVLIVRRDVVYFTSDSRFVGQVDVVGGRQSMNFGVVRYKAQQCRSIWLENSGRLVPIAYRYVH